MVAIRQLFRDLWMAVQEAVHVRHLGPRYAVIAAPVFTPVIALLVPHEGVWVFFELLPNSRMIGQELPQIGMIVDKLPVVDQLRIFAQLFRDLRMPVEELIHGRHFTASYVLVPILAAIEAFLLMHERVWILADLLADFRMLR